MYVLGKEDSTITAIANQFAKNVVIGCSLDGFE